MSDGIRATVELPTPGACPITDVARNTDSVVERVWRSVPPAGSAAVTEFEVEATSPPEHPTCEHVLSLGDRHLLRHDHDGGDSCPCECLGGLGCPIQRYVATPVRLRLVFNAVDYDELQTAVQALLDRFPDLDVRRLVRSPDANESDDPVFVDRGRLTDRQLEVLATAYRMGYFDRPRGANATEVAAELEVDPSTVAEHLAAAQSKLFGDVLEDR